jgi:tetratricopeptide (TPR) repeat protein
MRIGSVWIALALCFSAEAASAADSWPPSLASEEAFRQGDYATSHGLLEADLELCEASRPVANECLDLLINLSNVGARFRSSQDDEAYARRAVALAERSFSKPHLDQARAYLALANRLFRRSRYEDVEALYLKAIRVETSLLPDGDPQIVTIYSDLVLISRRYNRLAETEKWLRVIIAMMERTRSVTDPELVVAYSNLATALTLRDELEEALKLYRRVVAIRQKAVPQNQLPLAQSYEAVAYVLHEQRRYEDAEYNIRQALVIYEAQLPPSHPKLMAIRKALSSNLEIQKIEQRGLDGLVAHFSERWTRYASRAEGEREPTVWNLIEELMRRGISRPKARTILLDARTEALRRLLQYNGFTPEAQRDLEKARQIFRGSVRLAWEISGGAK